MFMPADTIVGNGSNKPSSVVSQEWFIHLDNKNIIPEVPLTVHNRGPREMYSKDKHTFTVDGLHKKNVFEFYGCYFHGCRKCHPEHEAKYIKTQERKLILEKNGYTLTEMWECEWKAIKSKWIISMMLKQKLKPGILIFVIVFLVAELKLSKAMQNALAINRFVILM